MLVKRPKEIWNTIHKLLNQTKYNTINEDPNTLNEHFNSTSERLTQSERKTKTDLELTIANLSENGTTSFKLRTVTYSEVKKAISMTRNDSSTGPDNLPISLLKPMADKITSPLTHIINGFIKANHFPAVWKQARISPIPKVCMPASPSDYRPISVLPILSKVYERLAMLQVVEFIELTSSYKDTQHGFRKCHSTITCLLKLRDDILRSMKKGEITISVFADYSKAFDTIEYGLLLKKLHQLNFSKEFLSWILSYLTDRRHYVQIDDKMSERLLTGFGVPQGSILGPVLFNLYVADLTDHLETSKSLQYADDTSIYKHCRPSDVGESVKQLETDINALKSASMLSNLIFNQNKTVSMYFASHQIERFHKSSIDSITIKCDTKPLKKVEDMKILGVIFDKNLSWKPQINKIVKESFATLRVLKQIRRLLPFAIRKQLATSLVLSKIDYGNIITNNLPNYLVERLQKVQNAAAGFVIGKRANIMNVINLSWLPVVERFQYSVATLAYKVIKEKYPKNICLDTKVNKRDLRNKPENSGVLVECHNNHKSFQHDAKNAFNDLPKEIRESLSYSTFKSKTKSYLLDKAVARNFCDFSN